MAGLRGRPDYGLDGPTVVRNLFVVAAVGLTLWATAKAGLWPGFVAGVPLHVISLCVGLGCLTTGCGMVFYSLYGKLLARERLLRAVPWRGDERVLDVGCGRGLLLIGAARRLTTGRAVGVDIWQAEDLSGNRPEAVLENARKEGVADRVEVRTADMRQLPFPDGSFDVVVSSTAIHNLYHPPDRDRAVREIARVLAPGGRVVIADIRFLGQYARVLESSGCVDVRRRRTLFGVLRTLVVIIMTMGRVRPGLLTARKGEGLPPTVGAS